MTTDESDNYYSVGSSVELTCTVMASEAPDPDSCSFTKATDPLTPVISDQPFRFGNVSCGNFQVT